MPAEVNNIADIDLVARVVRHYGTGTLASLLRDRSTDRSIIWASAEYERMQLAVPCRIFDWRARKPQAYKSVMG